MFSNLTADGAGVSVYDVNSFLLQGLRRWKFRVRVTPHHNHVLKWVPGSLDGGQMLAESVRVADAPLQLPVRSPVYSKLTALVCGQQSAFVCGAEVGRVYAQVMLQTSQITCFCL